MIILITGYFDKYDRNGHKTGEKEFVVSHGIDLETGKMVILPCDPPHTFRGAYIDSDIGEWVLPEGK